MGDAHAITVAAEDRGQSRSSEKERSDITQAALGDNTSPGPSAVWRRGATVLLGQRSIAAVGGRLAARRGRALALVYHRVRPQPVRTYEVVPCVPVEQFRGHVETLLAMGDIVPVDELIIARRSRRPRFALTFDDDYATHVRHVLPVLRGLSVPATFFLSGRALHGLGPYWWEVLEAWMRHDGTEQVAKALDVPRGGTARHRGGLRGGPGAPAPPRGRWSGHRRPAGPERYGGAGRSWDDHRLPHRHAPGPATARSTRTATER